MAVRKINTYFKVAASKEETIPKEWQLPHPRPKLPETRPVGRPKKRKEPEIDSKTVEKESEIPTEIGNKRRKYQSYSDQQRRDIIELSDQFGVRAIGLKFKISSSTICSWKKNLKDDASRRKGKRFAGGGRNISYSVETDSKIAAWVLMQRDLQLPVTRELLQRYALALIKTENKDFKASDGWMRHFFIRHNLTLRCHTSLSQKLPADLEMRLKVFYNHLREVRLESDFDDEYIINMDEVPMFFELVPSKTISKVGEKDVRVLTTGCEKRHFTLVLAVTSSGKALPPMIIFKGKRDLNVKVPKGWIVKVNEKAWMNSDMMMIWLRDILRVYTDRRPSLLVLDSFSGHTTEEVQKEMKKYNATPAVIPGGCTSKAQPLDVTINKPFKDKVRKCWVNYMQSEMDKCVKEGQNVTGIAKPDKQQVLDWIVSSWNEISENKNMIMKSFLVTGISNALNGSEDQLIRSDDVISEYFTESDDNNLDFDGFIDDDIEEHDDPFADLW